MKPIYPCTFNKLNAVADGIDAITLTGLIAGSTITVHGPQPRPVRKVRGPNDSLTFDRPGRYEIQIAHEDYSTINYTAIIHPVPVASDKATVVKE